MYFDHQFVNYPVCWSLLKIHHQTPIRSLITCVPDY